MGDLVDNLKEIIDIICSECKGGCCKFFPVFVKDIHNNRMFQNPTYIEPTTGMTTLHANMRASTSIACYYYSEGGCLEEVKPDICKDWYCAIFDEFVWGKIRSMIIGSEALFETRDTMKQLLKP